MDVKIDKRTKEYKDSLPESGLTGDDEADVPVNYEMCNDPHEIGCTKIHPPNDIPRSRKEPCYDCVWRNL